MKWLCAILMSLVVGLSNPLQVVSASACEDSLTARPCCCGAGCTCSASESPATESSPATPAATQQHEILSLAEHTADWSFLLPTIEPAPRGHTNHPSDSRRLVPLYHQHCSLLC